MRYFLFISIFLIFLSGCVNQGELSTDHGMSVQTSKKIYVDTGLGLVQ